MGTPRGMMVAGGKKSGSKARQVWDYLRGSLGTDLAGAVEPGDFGTEEHIESLGRMYDALAGGMKSGASWRQPPVSVVIPVHIKEKPETFLLAVDSLLRAEEAPLTEIIIVLNGKVTTGELTESEVFRLAGRIGLKVLTISYLEEEKYREISRPQNIFVPKQRGYEEAAGRIVIATDIDCFYDRHLIRSYQEAFEKDDSLLAAYGPVQWFGTRGPVGKTMTVISAVVKALKIFIGFPPFAGHNHALRKSLCAEVPGLYQLIRGNCNDIPGILKRELARPEKITSFVRPVPGAVVATYFPKETESISRALSWMVEATLRNIRNIRRLRKNVRDAKRRRN